VDIESERMERRQLERLSTTELVRHALTEARLLVKAEILHAKQEVKEEVKAARTSAILLGAGAVLALVGVAALLVALGMAIGGTLGVAVVGAVLVAIAVGCALMGKKKLPTQPLPHTQERLKTDYQLTRESLQ
jgi:uncharacterized membrane protein YqjE